MSTVAEHIAILEFYKTNERHAHFHEAAWLFTQTHWRELAAYVPTAEMAAGRASVAAMLREQHGPESADPLIAKWTAALPPAPVAQQVAAEPADEKGRLAIWATERWHAEVAYRPLVNVHRRTLDDTWRQVLRYAGADPVALLGPAHDEMLVRETESRQANRGATQPPAQPAGEPKVVRRLLQIGDQQMAANVTIRPAVIKQPTEGFETQEGPVAGDFTVKPAKPQ